MQENGWNNTGGGENDRTRATHGGRGVFAQETHRQIEDTWGEKMAEELNKGKKE
jgi:hypothetical protein